MSFLPSGKVKIFPSAYRGSIDDNIYDPESRLFSEKNITSLINRIQSINRDGFVFGPYSNDYSSSGLLTCSIHGYLFELDFTDYDFGDTTKLYGYIKVRNKGAIGPTDYSCYSLSPLNGDNEELDAKINNVDYFVGLELSSTPKTSNDSNWDYGIQLLEKKNNKWVVPAASKFALDSSLIEDTEKQGEAISDYFTTTNLFTNYALINTLDSDEGLSIESNVSAQQDLNVLGDTTLSGALTINNQATGFKVTGGTTSKTLDVQANTTVKGNTTINATTNIQGATNIYTPLDIGVSGNTSKITIKQNNNKTLTIAGAKSSAQAVTFSGDSTFQAGNYSSSSTSGSEIIQVGGNTFNIVTRDTNQTISGNKTHTGILTAPTFTTGKIGSCASTKDTVNKTSPNYPDNFQLVDGAQIIVYFRYHNEATNPTLNVNSTGDKPILLRWTNKTSLDTGYSDFVVGTDESHSWQDTSVVHMYYSESACGNNGAWVIIGHQRTTPYLKTTVDNSHILYLLGSESNNSSTTDEVKKDTSVFVTGGTLNSNSLSVTNDITSTSLHIDSNADASASSNGALRIGKDTNTNQMRIDNNEIMALKYNSTSGEYDSDTLNLNNSMGATNGDGLVRVGTGGLRVDGSLIGKFAADNSNAGKILIASNTGTVNTEIKACTKTVGSANQPVYVYQGALTPCAIPEDIYIYNDINILSNNDFKGWFRYSHKYGPDYDNVSYDDAGIYYDNNNTGTLSYPFYDTSNKANIVIKRLNTRCANISIELKPVVDRNDQWFMIDPYIFIKNLFFNNNSDFTRSKLSVDNIQANWRSSIAEADDLYPIICYYGYHEAQNAPISSTTYTSFPKGDYVYINHDTNNSIFSDCKNSLYITISVYTTDATYKFF